MELRLAGPFTKPFRLRMFTENRQISSETEKLNFNCLMLGNQIFLLLFCSGFVFLRLGQYLLSKKEQLDEQERIIAASTVFSLFY